MSAVSSLAVQQAVYAQLNGDATLTGLVTGVFDAVPQGTAYPYVVIDEHSTRHWSTTTTQGMELRMNIHVFSREAGRRETLTILERIYTLLHEVALTVTGQSFAHVRLAAQEVVLEDDAFTFHGTQTYRITTHV